MVAAAYDWSGLYNGINGGWTETNDRRVSDPAALVLSDYDVNGHCRPDRLPLQNGAIVFGLAAQGKWPDFNGSPTNLGLPAGLVRSRKDAFGLFTVQVGYCLE
jgi:outer membrane immunogenic protein